jgi:hypothetical protein
MDPVTFDATYQDEILPHVSRTFALTIPQLPAALRVAVTNAYLLCRIADTIEDEPALSPAETLDFMQRFVAVVGGRGDPALLGRELEKRLTDRTLPAERDLIVNMQRVIDITLHLNEPQRAGPPTSTIIATTSPASSATCSPSFSATIPPPSRATARDCKASPCHSRRGCR